MSNNNFNDFFDEELKKQEAKQNNSANNQDPFGFGAPNNQQQNNQYQQKHEQMYRVVPEYNGQQKFIQKSSGGKKGFIIAMIAISMIVVYFLGYISFIFFNPDMKFIGDVLGLVKDYGYVTEESDDPYAHNLAYQAANAMLKSIDKYSRLLTPEEYYQLLYPQEIPGISNGLSYSVSDDGEYYIAEVEVGSPAYNAGLFMGDVVKNITIINNSNTDGVSDGSYPVSKDTNIEDFKKYIHSTNMYIVVERDGVVQPAKFVQQKDFDGTAVEYYFGDTTTNMSLEYKTRLLAGGTWSDDVGYIRLTSFMDPLTMDGEHGQGDFSKAMALFKNSGKKKLIFDLTYNTGGRDDICSLVASYLVHDSNKTDGKGVVISVDRDKDDNVVGKTTTDSVYQNYFDVNAQKPQIVVLTNGNSASASEMLIGAMLDYGTAVQVGTTSYGKGIGQGVIQIRPATAVIGGVEYDSYWAAYITYVKFFTPQTNKCMHGIGFAPSESNVAESFEEQVSRALQLLA